MLASRLKNIWFRLTDEPFRVFFLLGSLCALLGVSYWPVKLMGFAYGETPAMWHRFLQILGFLFAFIIGFLTTALPKLTQAERIKTGELLLLILLHVLCVGFVMFEFYPWALATAALLVLVLSLVLFQRFVSRKRSPPESFVFLPFGLLCGFLGFSLMSLYYFFPTKISDTLFELSRVLSFQAFILYPIVGVGGFLVRSILGFAQPMSVWSGSAEKIVSYSQMPLRWHLVAAIVLLASFFIEVIISRQIGLLTRAAVVTVECKIGRASCRERV